MSTSKTYQQSLADAGSETRPPMLERGSYIPWASRFRRYLNRKRDNRKWLLKALDEGPYVFKNFIPEGSTIPRLQTAEDLEGDDLLLHDAEMEWNSFRYAFLIIFKQFKKLVKCFKSKEDRKFQTFDSSNPLVSAMLLLAKAITQNFSNLTNNRLRASSNTRNQAIIQGDRVNIQSRNSGNTGRNSRRAYVQEEVAILQLFNATNVVKKDIMLGIVQSQGMEEIEELSANIYLMARIQPADHTSDDGTSYESAFISEVQSSSIDENNEPIYGFKKDELIIHVSEKTYAYGAIRAENQNLLSTISELKTRLEKVEKGKSVNTKFDKTNGYQSLLCVTPLNKHAFQKKTDVPKTEENHVVSKPVTLQTSPTKQTGANQNTNVIRPGIMNATSRVRRPMSRDSHVAHSVLDNSKKAAKNVAVYVRKNKQTNNTSANVISNKENVIDVDAANASKAKTLLCVSCMQNVLIPCHDKCGRESNLYTISISDMAASSPVCLMSKATLTNLSHVQSNFNKVMVMAPKTATSYLDHLCSTCERGKSKKASHPPKLVLSDHSKLELLYMDLYGPMRVASINGKKYILVIVEDLLENNGL
ncbi:hypothetical protein Tco_0973322 [Tanacetum coccineum]